MRIIFNVASLKYPLTGIGHYTQALLSGLQKDERIAEVLCFTGSKLVRLADATYLLSPSVATRKKTDGLRRLVRGFPGAYQLRSRVGNAFFHRACRPLRGKALYHETNFILRPFDGISLTTIHDLSHIHYPRYHPPERVRYLESELPKTLARATHIITDSQFVREELISSLGVAAERITAVPLGVGSRYRPRREAETRKILDFYHLQHGQYLLAVATMEPRKNLPGLIAAYMRLPVSLRRRFPLVLAGDHGWKSLDLEKTISSLEAKGEIRRLGYLPAEHLPCVYSGAGAFAFPSFYEGFGLPPLEAMASGVPVLTADNTSLVEVVGDAAILVGAEDNDAILVGLERLLTDEEFRRTARQRGLAQASRFTWKRCIDQLVSIYRNVSG